MKRVLWMVLGTALLAVGCRTVGPWTAKDTPTVGQPLVTVLHEQPGQAIEFFDKAGAKALEQPKDGGSVSIHRPDRTGQDNYSFDANGVITNHKRSYGDDYGRGLWVEAK